MLTNNFSQFLPLVRILACFVFEKSGFYRTSQDVRTVIAKISPNLGGKAIKNNEFSLQRTRTLRLFVVSPLQIILVEI